MSAFRMAQEVQKIMNAGGFYTGAIDGRLGQNSQRGFDRLRDAALRDIEGLPAIAGPVPVTHGARDFGAVGKIWTPDLLRVELAKTVRPVWAKFVVMHHTGAPALADRPDGFSVQHMRNIAAFYKRERGWSEGPHLFVDEDQAFGLTSLQTRGIHAPTWNDNGIGIEVLGDYDREDPLTMRGRSCWTTAAKVAAILCDWLEIVPSERTIMFHRECPVTLRTSRKSCPGNRVEKSWVLDLIRAPDWV